MFIDIKGKGYVIDFLSCNLERFKFFYLFLNERPVILELNQGRWGWKRNMCSNSSLFRNRLHEFDDGHFRLL